MTAVRQGQTSGQRHDSALSVENSFSHPDPQIRATPGQRGKWGSLAHAPISSSSSVPCPGHGSSHPPPAAPEGTRPPLLSRPPLPAVHTVCADASWSAVPLDPEICLPLRA